jgi:cell wall-associated NlpC family hydrolase
MLVACGDSGESTSTDSTYTYSSDVPGIELPMLSADFWIDRLGDDSQRLTARAITTFNTANFAGDPYLYDLTNFPDSLNHDQLLQLLDQVSRPSTSARYYENGSPVSDADYARLEASLQREAVPAEVPVRWGLVVQRDSLRTFPTRERVFKQTNDLDLDRFQETGVFPGQTLALLHESADGNWWFAVNYHYAAWVPKQSVAEGTRQEIEQWINRSLRLVVTGAQIKTNFNPVEPRTAQVLLDMGVTLPLMSSAEVGHNVNGQNPYASYVVSLPVRATNGELEFKPALIARSQDVRVGHLPYKPSLVLRQAFKFLGERYGWGHDYNARDCTGFVGEVYKSFGILMPRNSGQQGQSAFAPTQTFQPDAREEKALALEQLQVGDLIYIPGHVMMYIGHVDNEPYVIHDVTGLAYFDSSENFYRGTLSGVSVTPLTKLWLNPETNFVDRIYAIKSIH